MDDKYTTEFIDFSRLYEQQRNLRGKSERLAHRVNLLQTQRANSHITKQLRAACNCDESATSKKGKTKQEKLNDDLIEQCNHLPDLLNNRLSQSQLEKKIDKLLRSDHFACDRRFRCETFRQTTNAGFLAQILKRYGDKDKKFSRLTPLFRKRLPLPSSLQQITADSGVFQKLTLAASAAASQEPRNGFDARLKVLRRRLHDFDAKLDSDATDLSSDADESCDDQGNEGQKRSSYRWQAERARLGSKTFYIRSQIAKIEELILQHAEMYRNIRLVKFKSLNMEEKQLKDGSEKYELDKRLEDLDESEQCARIKPYLRRLRTRLIDLALIRKHDKTSRTFSKIHCFAPFSSCVSCSLGQKDKNSLLDECTDSCYQCRNERLVDLDHSYPCLCASEGRDIPLDKKLESLWNKETDQSLSFAEQALYALKKPATPGLPKRNQSKSTEKDGNVEERLATSVTTKKHPLVSKKTLKTLKVLVTRRELLKPKRRPLLAAKFSDDDDADDHVPSTDESSTATEGNSTKKSYDPYDFVDDDEYNDPDWSEDDDGQSSPYNGNKRKRQSSNVVDSDSWPPLNRTRMIGRPPTTAASRNTSKSKGGKSAGKLSGHRRSTLNNTYDIDNIVIDPSVAAATRIEILQYKEIDTPGWRENTIEPSISGQKIEEEDISAMNAEEDLSDESYVKRHNSQEVCEHNRFQTAQLNSFTSSRKSSIHHSVAVTVATVVDMAAAAVDMENIATLASPAVDNFSPITDYL